MNDNFKYRKNDRDEDISVTLPRLYEIIMKTIEQGKTHKTLEEFRAMARDIENSCRDASISVQSKA
jgi:flagellin-specific chaperone FliS